MFRLIRKFFVYLSIMSLFTLLLLTNIEVIFRYGLRSYVPDAHFFSGMLMIMMIIFYLAEITYQKDHITVTIIVDKLPIRAKKIIDAVTTVFGICLFSIMTYGFLKRAIHSFRISEYVGLLETPLYPIRFVIFIGFLLATFSYIVIFFNLINNSNPET